APPAPAPDARTRPAAAVVEPPPVEAQIRRREPIEPPVLDRDAWYELLVAVEVNGAALSDGSVVMRGPDGRLAARAVELRGWRLRLDQDRIILLNGEPFYPLDALGGGAAAVELDLPTLTVRLTVPPGGFEATRVDAARPSALEPSSGVGGFLDYDALVTVGEGLPAQVDALAELGVFNGFGVFLTSVRGLDLTRGARGVARLDTTLFRDLPGRRATLRLGDSFTGGGALGRPVRFGGVQYATDFGTDPTFITYPVPTIGGLAEQQAVVDVFINNTRQATQEVPPGPFELESLPVVTGAGEVQLRVVDLLGRERIISQPYYVSSRLLKRGLSAFSYELGAEREGFGDDSFDYGDPLVAGTHRYGLTDGLTVEGHAELGPERRSAGAGLTGIVPRLGLLSGGLVGSHDGDEGGGHEATLEYEYLHPRLRLGARTRHSSEGFRQLGLDGVPPRRVDQLNLGLNLDRLGRVGLFLVNTEERVGADRLALSGSYGLSVGPGSLLVSAVQALEPDDELALSATYSLPLAPAHSLSATAFVDRGGEDARGRVELFGGRGATDLGPSYRLAAEAGGGRGARRIDGTLAYDARVASARLDVEREDERGAAARAGLSGGVAVLDGRAGLTRRIGRAFGLVAVPGFSDVPVYLENREVGRTDEEGYLLLPSLSPYLANRVRIDPTVLPLDAEVGGAEAVAVPFARSGVTVAFPVRRQRSALATLLDAAGGPLPAGLGLASLDGRMTARVARDGLAYITGVADGPVVLTSEPAGGVRHGCRLPHPLPDEAQARLGEIRCEPR
ncbi:MAG TPA: fimbria/pilus outer membrane usher protein, partial [Geminicoccaceae bacterium]|nr:fimbria/pilus outer membrane usher protein [Geminicoccaceae bacterium]